MNIQSYLKTAHNRSLAKWRVTCFYDILVLNQSAVLRLNFCAKIPPLRQAANRYGQVYETTTKRTTADKRTTEGQNR